MRINACVIVSFVAFLAGLVVASAEASYPFDVKAGKASEILESDSAIGLHNNKTAVLFSKKDGSLLGVWNSDKKNILLENNMGKPLFKLTLFHKIPYKSVVRYLPLSAKAAKSVEFSQAKTHGARELKIAYKGIGVKVERRSLECEAVVSVKLPDDSESLLWSVEIEMKNNLASVWDVDFPILAVKNPDENEKNVKLVYPYRRGTCGTYRTLNQAMPYPGPAVKFQFMAVYGEKTGTGFYYGIRDSEGFAKILKQRTFPDSKATLLGVRHLPANRLIGGTGFTMPYSVETKCFNGDWWDAARIYRKWWIRQKWASKGVMLTRKDVPAWLKNAEAAVKVSTSKPSRTIPLNLKNARELRGLLGDAPILGIWYNYQPLAKKRFTGYGFDVKPREGVKEALGEFKKMNYHIVAYVQSLIYDQVYKDAVKVDSNAFLIKDIIGGTAPYYDKVCACRFTSAWHERINKMADTAMKAGFEGIYLDSFGKSSPECFARNHGHAIGGGNTGIVGQRAMATKVRKLIKSLNPLSAMAGEAPVEAFVDKLDYYLFAVNCMTDYVPIWRTVFGDYMVGHGRGLAFSKARDNVVPSLATLFLEGAIFGRVQLTSKCLLLDKGNEKQKEFFKRLVEFNENGGLEYLRFGEYLKPVELTPVPKLKTFMEYVQRNKVAVPMVMNSVTKSHKDGSVAIVFVNVGEETYKGSFEIPSDLLDEKQSFAVFAMSADGRKTKTTTKRTVEFEIAPNDVKFFIVKPGL